MYTFCYVLLLVTALPPPPGGRGLPNNKRGDACWNLWKEPFRGTNVIWAWLVFFSPLRHPILNLHIDWHLHNIFNSEKSDLLLVKLIVKYLLSYCFRLNTLKAHGTMKAPALELLRCLKWRASQYRVTGTKNAFSNLQRCGKYPPSFYVEVFSSKLILVPRSRPPFGQHQKSRPPA